MSGCHTSRVWLALSPSERVGRFLRATRAVKGDEEQSIIRTARQPYFVRCYRNKRTSDARICRRPIPVAAPVCGHRQSARCKGRSALGRDIISRVSGLKMQFGLDL